jgi:hypothetical protein
MSPYATVRTLKGKEFPCPPLAVRPNNVITGSREFDD